MTIAAPHCTCDDSIFPSFGPCPVHGSKHTKNELEMYREAAAHQKQENDRLRELYENAVQNRDRFGWTINHLLECEEALSEAQGRAAELEAELAKQEAVMVAADRLWTAYQAMLDGEDVGRLPDWESPAQKGNQH